MALEEVTMSVHAVASQGSGTARKVGSFMAHEFLEMLPPTIFFFLGFNLILFTKRLFLAAYLIEYTGFLIATTGALVVGKVVLVADTLPFLRRFDYAPLAYPILFKTAVYTVLVFFARLLEALAHYLFGGGALGGGRFVEHMLGEFSWPHFIATHLWIFVLFLIYVAITELNNLLGDGELFRIFFTRPSSALKTTRRARIRLLTRMSRLTSVYGLAALEDPLSQPHRELITILKSLAEKP